MRRLNPTLNVLCAITVLGLTPANALRADENLFGYTYGAETLPRGESELYTWQTFRFGKESGSYFGWDQKYEYEWGITDRLQASLYLNFNAVDIEGVPASPIATTSALWAPSSL
jgi:hypothetical protein